jgi:hypothetical protein
MAGMLVSDETNSLAILEYLSSIANNQENPDSNDTIQGNI